MDVVITEEHAREQLRFKVANNNMYKSDQIESLSNRLNVHHKVVSTILNDYRNMLRFQIRERKGVSFLNLVNMRGMGTQFRWYETTGKQAYNIAQARGMSWNIVLGVLQAYRMLILEELTMGRTVVVNGLLTLTPRNNKVYLTMSDSLEGVARGFILDCMKHDMRKLTRGYIF